MKLLKQKISITVLMANIELTALEITMGTVMRREVVILKEYIEMKRGYYDYILNDCIPSLGILTLNALAAADSVIIPKGVPVTVNWVKQIRTKNHLHHSPRNHAIDYILIENGNHDNGCTFRMDNSRTISSHNIYTFCEEAFLF